MKFTAFLCLVACLQVSAAGTAQNVTYSGKDVSLKKIFRELNRQTGFEFLYKDSYLKEAKPVNLSVKNVPITDVLDICFANQPLSYEIIENTVIVKTKPAERLSTLLISRAPAAPSITVSGKILNENGEPVVASVMLKGTDWGTTSNDAGNFILHHVDEKGTLVVSGANIITKEVKVNGKTNLIIPVQLRVDEIKSVTVSTGYWTTTKQRNTGSISKVTSKDIERQPVTSPLLALQGMVPGLEITPMNGAPGAAPKIRIRGENSLRRGYGYNNGNYPLYVIDGLVFDSRPLQSESGVTSSGPYGFGIGIDPLVTIGPENIESIEILKDAGATAIYGSQGANGVILITTKKGIRRRKTELGITVYRGIEKMPKRLDVLNTQEYIQMRKEAFANGGNTPADFDYDLNRWDTTRYTDWQDVLIGGTSDITNANIEFSGGTEFTSFRLSGGYLHKTTIFPGDFENKRISGDFSFNHRSANDKFNVTFNANYGKSMNEHVQSNALFEAALRLPPNAPALYNDDGTLNWDIVDYGVYKLNAFPNPLAETRKKHESDISSWIVGSTLSYKILPALKFSTLLNYTETNGAEILKVPIASSPPTSLYSTGTAVFAYNRRNTWQLEPQLGYSKTNGKHHYELLAGMTFRTTYNSYQSMTGYQYYSDALLGSLKGAGNIEFKEDKEFKYRYNAVYGRVHYNYNEKYLIDLTARRDGSSRFGTNNRFGNFGAVAAAWIFSNEKFATNSLKFLSFGKLRSSYGITASDNIGDYSFYDLFDISTWTYGYGLTLTPSRLYNPDYQWERTKKLEIGLELGLFNNRITTEVSWYRNVSGNQLIDYRLPAVTGFRSVLKNFEATIENTGLEFFVSSKNIQAKNFQWTTTMNMSIPKNKLLAFPDLETSPYNSSYVVGAPLSGQYIYVWKGVNPVTGLHEIADLNNNGSVDYDNGDKIFYTGYDPKYYGGIDNIFTYQSLSLSFSFQFTKRVNDRFTSESGSSGGYYRTNMPKEVLDRWQKPGDITDIPKFTTDFGVSNSYFLSMGSDYNIVDASFLRLKRVSLSYSVPAKVINAVKLKEFVVFIEGQNLLTFTGYKGIDPETGPGAMPLLRMITGGIKVKI